MYIYRKREEGKKYHITLHISKSTTKCNFYLPCHSHICTNNKICPSNSTYMPHRKITSCADIWQPCVYIYLISSHHNQKCHHKDWYYLYMPLNKYACHIRGMPQFLNNVVFMEILPHCTNKSKQQQTATFIYHTITIYVTTDNIPLKCHRYGTYAYYFMCT